MLNPRRRYAYSALAILEGPVYTRRINTEEEKAKVVAAGDRIDSIPCLAILFFTRKIGRIGLIVPGRFEE